MKIRRFSNPRRSEVVKPKQKTTLPKGSFRVEFFAEVDDDNFPIGEWFAAALFPDRVEYYRLPLSGYQSVNRLVARFNEAVPVDGKLVYELVTGGNIKIMSLTNVSNTSD